MSEPVIYDRNLPAYLVAHGIPESDWDLEDYGDGPMITGWRSEQSQPTQQQVLDWDPASSVTDVEIANQYAGAHQAAEQIIFLLMARVSMALVGLQLQNADGIALTSDNINREGTAFVIYHHDPIDHFKDCGRHPDAGDLLYWAFFQDASKALFPWLNNATIQGIFANTIPRNV